MAPRPRRRCSPLILIGWVIASQLLQGCAAPGRAVQQTLRVETPGCPKARCSLGNDRGSWELASTPGEVTVTSSHAPLRVVCRSADGSEGEAGAASSLPAPGRSGAVVGGMVGTGVGLVAAEAAMVFIPPLGVVMVAFGAAVGTGSGQAIDSHRRDLRYPELITLPMNCGAATELAPGPARAPLGFGIRGLTPQQRLASGAGDTVAVQVTDVAIGGVAARAGLRPGDLVTAAGGQPVADAAALQVLVQALAVGEALRLRVWRDGESLDVVLVQPALAAP